jgi:hypothetical protein
MRMPPGMQGLCGQLCGTSAELARIGSHRQHNKTNNDNYDQKTSRGNTNNIAAHVKQLPAFSKEP